MEESPWKESIKEYFEEFMNFFFPKEAEEIDFEKGYEFLDKELEKVLRDSETGKKLADVLVKVGLHSGDERWILIHVEVQGYYQKSFSERMYIYNYRIYDFYGVEVVSLAILTDKSRRFKPGEYIRKFGGFELKFKFPVVKLIEYEDKKEELLNLENPFSLLVRAYLEEVSESKDIDDKMLSKLSLIKELYRRGYTKEQILSLYRFIDWIITLPEELTRRFHEEIRRYEEEKKMPYITTAEKIGIEKGIQIGIEQGIKQGIEQGIKQGIEQGVQLGGLQEAQEMVLEVLEERFEIVPRTIAKKIKQLDSKEVVKSLFRIAMRVSSLEEFETKLNKAMN